MGQAAADPHHVPWLPPSPVPVPAPANAYSLPVRGGELFATPAPAKGSHDLAAYARGTALVRMPAGAAPREAGGRCEVLPIG